MRSIVMIFSGLCVCVCVCVSACLLGITIGRAKADEPIVMPFGMWTRMRNHKGARIPAEVAAFSGDGAPLRCGLSSKFFDHLLVIVYCLFLAKPHPSRLLSLSLNTRI